METPLVGIIMGSDSDWPTLREATAVLDEFSVPWEATVASAHRAPTRVSRWATTAHERGLAVIIAAAGLAAHLPGVVAAHTTLPVIGLPVGVGALSGVDALYSIVQMPPGVPVAAVGIDAARNAALLAVQIVAGARPELQRKLQQYKQRVETASTEADARLQTRINGQKADKREESR